MDRKLRSRAIKTAAALPKGPTRSKLLVVLARLSPAVQVGTTVETPHLRIHRYRGPVEVTDLTNAGKRGKKVKYFSVSDDYLSGNDIAQAKFERWLGKVVKGMTYEQARKTLTGLMSELERGNTYPLPTIHDRSMKGVHVDPPQSVAKRVKMKVLETTERTLMVEAKPSNVSIREIVFSVNDGQRGPYLHDTVVSNTTKKRETKTLYNWVVANEAKLKRVKSLRDVTDILEKDGIPYRMYYLD